MSTQKPSGKGLMLLAVWGIICYCLFPLPVNLIICFMGIVVFAFFIALAESFDEKKEEFIMKDRELPRISKPKKKSKYTPRIRVEIKDDK